MTGLFAVVLGTTIGVGGGSPAAAAAGVPNDPISVFSEDFEAVADEDVISLGAYTGAGGQSYSASDYWLDGVDCNGLISSHASTEVDFTDAGCESSYGRTALRNMAKAIGLANGQAESLANGNNSVGSFTVDLTGPPAGEEIAFETAPIPLAGSGRFLTFGVDTAGAFCGRSQLQPAPLLEFSFLGGADPVSVTGTGIAPCDGAAATNVPSDYLIRTQSFEAPQALLFPGSVLTISMTNFVDVHRGDGNDYAFDNIVVTDVTPELDKAFSTENQAYLVGEPVAVTFTVTNTSELGAKTGWSFTDTLPAGMVVAETPNVDSTCTADVAATPGSDLIDVSAGSLDNGDTSCEITVDVTATSAGTFYNGPDQVDTLGLTGPATASVEFVDRNPSLTIEKHAVLTDTNNNGVADLDETVVYTFTVANDGTVDLENVVIADHRVTGITPGSIDLPRGAAPVTFTADPYTVTQYDIDRGGVYNYATVSGTAADGVIATSSNSVTIDGPERESGITLMKTAELDDRNGNGIADEGEEIIYSFEITNSGNVTIAEIRIIDPMVMEPDSVVAVLAPGGTELIAADPYTVTSDDVDHGEIINIATALGYDSTETVVESDPSSVTVATAEVEAPVEPTPDPVLPTPDPVLPSPELVEPSSDPVMPSPESVEPLPDLEIPATGVGPHTALLLVSGLSLAAAGTGVLVWRRYRQA